MTTQTRETKQSPVQSNGTARPNGAGHAAQNGASQNGATSNGAAKTGKPTRARKQSSAKKPAHREPEAVWKIVLLPIGEIGPNPYQPREAFDPAEMEELVASIRTHGVLQPVTVRSTELAKQAVSDKAGSGNKSGKKDLGTVGAVSYADLPYHLITGERRLRAGREAKLKTIPAIVRDDLSDSAAAELALVENLQRSNLNIVEEAAGYKRLMVEFRMKEERIAKKVGRSVQTVKDTIKLLNLPAEVRSLLAQKFLTPTHGQHLLRLAGFETICTQVAQRVVRDKLTAQSLHDQLLPNARELKNKKLIAELDWRTEFEWREECAQCPHNAYIHSGYSSYCLRPDEWQKKQDAATALKKEEAARVLEEARQEGKQTVEVEKLPAGSYRNLSWSTPPSGCTGKCPCRGKFEDPDEPTVKIPICLDPQRYQSLVQAEREAMEAERRRRCLALWGEAKAVLLQGGKDRDLTKPALLLGRHLLTGRARYTYNLHHDDQAWQVMLEQVGAEMSVVLPWAEILSACDAASDPDDYEEDAFEEEDSEIEGGDTEKVGVQETEKTPSEQAAMTLLSSVEPERLLMFTSAVLLVLELQEAVRYGGATPELDLVLGYRAASQMEMTHEAPDETLPEDAAPSPDDTKSPDKAEPAQEAAEDETAEDAESADEPLEDMDPAAAEMAGSLSND